MLNGGSNPIVQSLFQQVLHCLAILENISLLVSPKAVTTQAV